MINNDLPQSAKAFFKTKNREALNILIERKKFFSKKSEILKSDQHLADRIRYSFRN